MDSIVISPLTCGTFSTNHLDPHMNHVDDAFFAAVAIELILQACLSWCTFLSVLHTVFFVLCRHLLNDKVDEKHMDSLLEKSKTSRDDCL